MVTQRLPLTPWRKSSYSLNENACCVEVAPFPARIGVRDSKDPDGPVLLFSAAAWSGFLSAVTHESLHRSNP